MTRSEDPIVKRGKLDPINLLKWCATTLGAITVVYSVFANVVAIPTSVKTQGENMKALQDTIAVHLKDADARNQALALDQLAIKQIQESIRDLVKLQEASSKSSQDLKERMVSLDADVRIHTKYLDELRADIKDIHTAQVRKVP